MYWAYPVLFVIAHGLGLWMAVRVVMYGRTSQGAIAWSLALLLVPWLAVPFFLVLGDRKFVGYERANPRGTRAIDVVARQLAEAITPFAVRSSDDEGADRAMRRLARMPCTRGNAVELLIDGRATFDAILAAIDGANEYVCVQFYIFRDDGLGKRLQQALLAARKRGVRVHLLYDEIGCYSLPGAYLDVLRDGGCECTGFRTKTHKQRPFRLNFRNHRKIVVVDGRAAFVGGHNVGDEYLGLDDTLTPWRDTHVAMRGPAVQCVQLAFAEDWFWATEQVPEMSWTPRQSAAGDARVLIVATGPAGEFDSCSLLFTRLADAARSRLWMSTAYFVPDETVVSALQLAGMRGVDVRVMIPEISDSALPRLSSFTYYDEILPAGVKLHRYQAGFLHQKAALCDDLVCVSTANLDNRSFRINFEISVVVADAAFAEKAAAMLADDLSKSRAVAKNDFDQRTFWFRFRCRVARLMAPIQ